MALQYGRNEISNILAEIAAYVKDNTKPLPNVEERTAQAFVKSLTTDGKVPKTIDLESIKKRSDVNQASNFLENRLDGIDFDKFWERSTEIYTTMNRALGF